jgi:hypothetical protein
MNSPARGWDDACSSPAAPSRSWPVVSRQDYHDLVIETLADSEASLLDYIVELTIERDSYRVCLQQAIHLLHEREVQNRRLRESLRSMHEDRRRCVQGGR